MAASGAHDFELILRPPPAEPESTRRSGKTVHVDSRRVDDAPEGIPNYDSRLNPNLEGELA